MQVVSCSLFSVHFPPPCSTQALAQELNTGKSSVLQGGYGTRGQTDKQTDRQTDRQTDIQTDRHTDRQTDIHAGR